MPKTNGTVIVHGNKSARFRPEISDDVLKTHHVTNGFEKLKVTSQLPNRRFGGNEILSLVKSEYSNDEAGLAILIQRPNNPKLQPEDWRGPILSPDWKVVGGKLIDFEWCKKTNQCGCINTLLEKHFKDHVLDDLGWKLMEIDGQVIGLLIFSTENRR